MQHLRKAWANLQKFREHNAVLKMELDENRVVFIGDSIIAGWHAHPFFKENSHYINRGINGQTTSQILRRFKSDVIGLQPKYVLILVGTNDIAENNGRISLEEIQKNFESMLAIAAANQLKVVLGSVLPASSYYWNKNIIQPNLKIKALNQILSFEDIGFTEDIPETADTIEGNAAIKGNYVTEKYGYNCFADDSGLEIDFLNGAPGVFSARFAGEQKNDKDNIQKVLAELNGVENRKAQFKTVIALNLNGQQNLFTGIIKGIITENEKGMEGFGYDPIFQPKDYKITFAEMNQVKKSAISHRGLAVKKLLSHLLNLM